MATGVSDAAAEAQRARTCTSRQREGVQMHALASVLVYTGDE